MDGVHPDLVIGPSTEVIAGNGKILTAGGDRLPRPPDLPADRRRGARRRHHHAHRRRHRTGRGHQGHHGHPGRLAPGPDARGAGRAGRSTSLLLGKGNTVVRRGACGSSCAAAPAASSCTRTGAPRPAAIDACLRVVRRVRRAGRDPHRHAERGRLRRDDAAPRSPAGRSTRTTPRAPAAATRRTSSRSPAHPNVLPSLDQPDPAAHRQHARRAPRHADGLPPPQPGGARGPGLRREPHPAVDDRRRGRAARPRRDLDDRLGLPGDGPDRRGGHPHLADRARDEGAAAASLPGDGAADNQRARRYVAKYTICPAIAHGLDARGRLGRGRQAGRPGAVGPGVLRRAPARGGQGRHDRLGADGRRQRLDPHPAAGAAPADVRRRTARAPAATSRRLRGAGRARGRAGRPARRCDRRLVAGRGRPRAWPRPTCRSNDALPRHRGRPRHLRGAHRRRASSSRTRPPSCPMAQRYFLF